MIFNQMKTNILFLVFQRVCINIYIIISHVLQIEKKKKKGEKYLMYVH